MVAVYDRAIAFYGAAACVERLRDTLEQNARLKSGVRSRFAALYP